MIKNKLYFPTSLSSCFYKGNVALIKPAKAIKASKASFSLVSSGKSNYPSLSNKNASHQQSDPFIEVKSVSPNNKRRTSSPRFVTTLLNSLNDPNNILVNNEASQRLIENISFDEFEFILSNKTNKNIFADVNLDLLNPILGKYIKSKSDIMETYINNLFCEVKATINKSKVKVEDLLIANVINHTSKNSIFNFCLYYFVVIYSSQHIEDDSKISTVPVTVNIGKKIFFFYKIINKLSSKSKANLKLSNLSFFL